MTDLSDYFFGPLSKDYCLYFYFLMVLGFFALVFFLLTAIFYGIQKRKGFDFYMGVIVVAFWYFIFYLQSRILHTMCVSR